MNLLSIDPGKQGAVVLFDDGKIDRVWTAKSFIVGGDYDGYCMKGIAGCGTEAVIEKQWAQNQTGRSSAFIIGVGYGRWLQALAGQSVGVREIAPQKWTAMFKPRQKLSPKERKEHYVRLARQMHPSVAWDDMPKALQSGVADAILLGEYYLKDQLG